MTLWDDAALAEAGLKYPLTIAIHKGVELCFVARNVVISHVYVMEKFTGIEW